MYKSDEFLGYLKRIGEGVQIYRDALILKPEQIEIGDHSRLDDYCRVEGGRGVQIGCYVHICSFSSIYGGGRAIIGDYCGITQGARLITGTEQVTGVMSAAAPDNLRDAMCGSIVMESHSFIAANAVVLPNVVIGEGAVVAAGSVVRKNVDPWTIVMGTPAKFAARRKRLDLAGLRARTQD